MKTLTLRKIGSVEVDAGLLMVGDPCRFFPQGGKYCDGTSTHTQAYKDWGTVLMELNKGGKPWTTGNLRGPSDEDMATVIRTGGDGIFTVKGIFREGDPFYPVGFLVLTEKLPKGTTLTL